MTEPVLEVENCTVKYQVENGAVTAVSDASFSLAENEYLGIVGESGCGKSTLAKAIIGGLDPNGEVTSGKIRYRGREIQDMSERELNNQIRWSEISFIPQSSMNSLDPLEKIEKQAISLGKQHTDLTKSEILTTVKEMFEIVGLDPERISEYPHQFSGGMEQRVLIAFALFLEPSVLIADEPTTALDVIMQDRIMKYLEDIRDEIDLSMVLITHDISVVLETCDRMTVMHSGQVAESGTTRELYYTPRHPYTILLQESFPDLRDLDKELQTIEGDPPQMLDEVDYCTFAERCPWDVPECHESPPEPKSAAEDDPDHLVSCFRRDEVSDEYERQGVR